MSDAGKVIPFLGTAPRQPPSNTAAEQSLLGAILAGAKAFTKVEDFLRAEHFADPLHQRIFAAAAKRLQAGQIADPVTLRGEVDDPPYLAQLVAGSVGAYVAREYGLAIRDAWLRRQLIEMASSVVHRAHGDGTSTESILDAFAAEMEAIRDGSGEPQRGFTANEMMDEALAQADRACAGGTSGISTGMRSVDEAIGGLEPSTLTVLAGRPGSGKSSLGQQWAVAAARAGVPVTEFSLEMSAPALGRRILSAASGVPIWRMKRGQHAEYAERLRETRLELADLPIMVHDGGRMSGAEIAAKCRTAKRKHGLGLIVVDHLHLVRAEEATAKHGPTAQVTEAVDAMLGIAKQFACPVLLLAQLNRGTESRDDHRPTVADLRQSGAIEQNADTIAFVYREEQYVPRDPPAKGPNQSAEQYANASAQHHTRRAAAVGRAELLCEKVRDGEPQTVRLCFDGPTASFSETTL